MTYVSLSPKHHEWRERAEEVARRELAPRAAAIDRESRYPTESMETFRDLGWWGLRVSEEHGGLGEGLLTTVLVVEELAKRCPSTAMCFKMHLEGAELVSRIPTQDQVDRLVSRIARGEMLCTIAGSETGSGGAWNPAATNSAVERVDGGYRIDKIRKGYVTSAHTADMAYFTCRVGADTPQSQTSALIVERDRIDWEVVEPWDGLGMRGNASSPVLFSGFVPKENLLGDEGGSRANTPKLLPVVLATYAAVFLGIAEGAYDALAEWIAEPGLGGMRRVDGEVLLRRMAELDIDIQRTQAFIHAVALAYDEGRVDSLLPFYQAKIAASQTVGRVTTDAMTSGGGTAFAKRLPFERYFRDGRAAMVMGFADDGAILAVGRALFPKEQAPS